MYVCMHMCVYIEHDNAYGTKYKHLMGLSKGYVGFPCAVCSFSLSLKLLHN